MDIRFDGERALVTGGSSGIGSAIAMELAAAGAKVIVNYHSYPDAANEIVQQIEPASGEGFAVQADVPDEVSVKNLLARIDEAWGGIDILINNASIGGDRAISWESDTVAWQPVINVDLLGAFQGSRLALKRMIPNQAGVILTISSVYEQIAWSGFSGYTEGG